MAGTVRILLKSCFPFLLPPWRWIKSRINDLDSIMHPPRKVFTEIFQGNEWHDSDSRSGTGSNLAQTEVVRRVLPVLLRELNCKTFLDVPCGDFFWMKLVQLDVDYTGGDIVEELVSSNQRQYGRDNRRFIHLDLLRDKVPEVDLILCRDCFVHFSYSHIRLALKNMKKSGSTCLLTTTCVETAVNQDIRTGLWRPLNLQLPPFSFPTPLKLIDEECKLEQDRDKHLGLWKLTDIPDH